MFTNASNFVQGVDSAFAIILGISIFFLVTLSTFPCTIPFLIIKDPMLAMRVSNIVALTLLFLTGYKLGVYSGYNKWLLGIIVAALGVLLVLLTIALGG